MDMSCHIRGDVADSPREAACRRQFPSPVVASGSSFLQLEHMVDHQFRRPAHVRGACRRERERARISCMLHATNTQGSRAHDTGGRVAGDIGGVSCIYTLKIYLWGLSAGFYKETLYK